MINLASIHPRLVELAKKIDLGDKPEGLVGCSPCEAPRSPYYPTLYVSGRKEPIDLPDKGTATVEYRVRSRSSNKNSDQEERHSVDIEVQSIEPHEPEPEAKKQSALFEIRRMREIFFGSDPRARNSLGEYTSDAGEGVDPNQMAAAYGPPEVSQSHVERIKRFFGKRRAAAQGEE